MGDELGSRIVAARLARDLVRLCLLLDRRYAPYSKWLGTAFSRLEIAAVLGPILDSALRAEVFPEREEAMVHAFEVVARYHNDSQVAGSADPGTSLFFDRPYRVLGSGRFVDACVQQITDPWLRSLPLIGAIDQFVHSTDVPAYPDTDAPVQGGHRGVAPGRIPFAPVRAARLSMSVTWTPPSRRPM